MKFTKRIVSAVLALCLAGSALSAVSAEETTNYDINGDGKISIIDLMQIAKMISGETETTQKFTINDLFTVAKQITGNTETENSDYGFSYVYLDYVNYSEKYNTFMNEGNPHIFKEYSEFENYVSQLEASGAGLNAEFKTATKKYNEEYFKNNVLVVYSQFGVQDNCEYRFGGVTETDNGLTLKILYGNDWYIGAMGGALESSLCFGEIPKSKAENKDITIEMETFNEYLKVTAEPVYQVFPIRGADGKEIADITDKYLVIDTYDELMNFIGHNSIDIDEPTTPPWQTILYSLDENGEKVYTDWSSYLEKYDKEYFEDNSLVLIIDNEDTGEFVSCSDVKITDKNASVMVNYSDEALNAYSAVSLEVTKAQAEKVKADFHVASQQVHINKSETLKIAQKPIYQINIYMNTDCSMWENDYLVINSYKELTDFIWSNTIEFALTTGGYTYAGQYILDDSGNMTVADWNEYFEKYNEEYFKDNSLVLVSVNKSGKLVHYSDVKVADNGESSISLIYAAENDDTLYPMVYFEATKKQAEKIKEGFTVEQTTLEADND